MASLESIFPVNNVFPNNIEQSFANARKEASKKEAGDKTDTLKIGDSEPKTSDGTSNSTATQTDDKAQTSSDKVEISKLASRDREVRAHEAAHKAAGGQLTGPAQFDYEQGPDNKRYAVSGEVSIDTSTVDGNPQATIQKANQIKAAALAPANPSAQDRMVASQASVMAAEAQVELRQENQETHTEGINKSEKNTEDTALKNEGNESANVVESRPGNANPPLSAQAIDTRDFTANTEAAIALRPGAVLDVFA